MFSNTLKRLFFLLLVKPVVFIGLGLNLFNRERLPGSGPAIIAANHNSHLDTMVLMSLFPVRQSPNVGPLSAADYFLRNRLMACFALRVIGIIPLDRQGGASKEDLFAECKAALANGEILLLFPEGSRGDPEQMQPLRKGVYHLARSVDGVAVTPVVMHGLGRAMPKGGSMIVPFNCDVVVGEAHHPGDSADDFIERLSRTFEEQLDQCLTRRVEE